MTGSPGSLARANLQKLLHVDVARQKQYIHPAGTEEVPLEI